MLSLDSCRCKLVDGGLLTVFVDMLRDPSGYYKTLALHAIADFTKYSKSPPFHRYFTSSLAVQKANSATLW